MKYGPWALVAGASEGIGAAFAKSLAAQGTKLILVARRPGPLKDLAAQLDVETRAVTADLSTDDGLETVFAAAQGHEVGLVVANAAISSLGQFTQVSTEELDQILALNCRAPMLLARHFLPPMYERGQGGLIVMSSLAGQQGSPGLATYAASKAFGAILAEGLWAEARRHGVDVLTCVPGAVETPGLATASKGRAPGTVSPDVVVQAALKALGRKPRTVPGAMMRFSAQLMTRLLPKKTAINTIAKASGDVLS
ncbi:SDR family NAD(P)-dependent oxidoreductase [Catelliglobosispora koreensis]|uniref:SDR family NAD(P)-dependent oxidoreductase n=1 Tax=Catelliglobosispora koreensis TaxID=129052 RepID=UPI0003704515|nr:SDR family NAD(P)-dependent oxidoreductase [Catelliglobosispora koreensis]